MAQPIYKFWTMKFKDAWYKMSSEEQNEALAKIEKALKDVGGERVITCNSYWNSESFVAWGVEKFPDIEAVQKYSQLLLDAEQPKFVEGTSYLGTEWPIG